MTNRRVLLSIGILMLAVLLSPAVIAQSGSGQLLVWLEDGPSPTASSPSAAGQIGFLGSAGELTPLIDVPAQAGRVHSCGTSADGVLQALFIGGDTGTIYLMNGANTPVVLADSVDAYACTGWDGLQFSPDGSRVAYLAYEADARQSEFGDGTLNVINTGDLSRQLRYEKVTSFDVNSNGVAFVSFFVNDRNEADEVGVFWWEGSGEREVVTLTPDEDCRFTSAAVGIAPDNNLLVVLGHRCKAGDTRTSWQIYRVETATGSATMAASDFQPGQFAAYARTNSVIFSANGDAYFTVPDGITANTVGIRKFSAADMSAAPVIEQQAVMATFSGSPNAAPIVSPNGRWMSVVVTSPNNENTLNVIDLTNAGIPFTYAPTSSDDAITAMSFSPDSSTLYIISGAGDARNGEYKLTSLNLNDGSTGNIKRGRFAPLLAVGGSTVALMEYQTLDDPQQPPYVNLITINPSTNETLTLLEGATIADNKVTEQRFAAPIAFR